MKTFTVTVPDNVRIVSATYISTELFNTWAVNQAFTPEDGMEIKVCGGETRENSPPKIYYNGKEKQ